MKRVLITFYLASLVIAGFFIRLDNFQRAQIVTTDENVYYRLGLQLKNNFLDYNTLPYADDAREQGRTALPTYFTEPLFKHPPLFPFLISQALRWWGETGISAAAVSILFGVLMIPLTYALALLIFGDRWISLAAAFFLFLDPIHMISSQKIWMESTLSFFMLMTIYLFLYGLKHKKDFFFLLSGLSSGLAFLTKYPGILSTLSIVLYSMAFHRELFKKSFFRISLILPFLMILPWGYWNYQIYGMHFILEQFSIHEFDITYSHTFPIIGGLLIIFIGAALLYNRRIKITLPKTPWRFILSLLFCGLLIKQMLQGFDPQHIPISGWAHAPLFGDANFLFYFGRLLEFSPLYFLVFLSFFKKNPIENTYLPILKISAGMILLFYSLWGGFQSRYILASIPFLIILGVWLWQELWTATFKQPCPYRKHGAQILLIILMVFIIYKTLFINFLMSFSNNLCYF
ncbi:MAG: glycosyltransferase family 39 protein [Candidatus Omnitrophica bacterium]|nr:glycosyltransferase family 39 protein [Candidatus Omnitrophota bacterium]